MAIASYSRRRANCPRRTMDISRKARFVAGALEFCAYDNEELCSFYLPVEIRIRWGAALRAAWRALSPAHRQELRAWLAEYSELANTRAEAENAREAVAFLDDGLLL